MSTTKGIPAVFGGAGVGPERYFKDQASVAALFDVLKKHGVTTIDTAQLYAGSEELLGKCHAGNTFTLDTKAFGGFQPGSNKNIVANAKESIRKLGVPKVDIFYLHAPDASVPMEDTLAAINEVHAAGLFTRFGLSNFQAADVAAYHKHCAAHNYVLPSVYQGNYSPVARKQEEVLFPTLRKLNIAFYAYSPLAGGFLTKTAAQIDAGAGRFDANTPIGKIYSNMYSRPAYIKALEQWAAIAEKEGCSRADLAYRWVAFHSPLTKEKGDAIIVGASKLEQVEQTLAGLEAGPLSKQAVEGIQGVWKTIEHEAPLDNYHG